MVRVRLRFTKLGKIRFTSHRDVARMWERAFRRADVAVAYTEGFSPRPRLHFGLALSNGYESLGEYVDADLVGGEASALDLDQLLPALSAGLPVGIDATAAVVIERSEPSLQDAVDACSWTIVIDRLGMADAEQAIAGALAAPSLIVMRNRKGVDSEGDVRPALSELSVAPPPQDSDGVTLQCTLATRPAAVRPTELVAALLPGIDEDAVRRVCRTHQWIERDGALREPLPAGATSPVPALAVGA